MIYEAILYGIKCDRCHQEYEDDEGHTVFCDKGDAKEKATEDDWYFEDGKHYCPNCYVGFHQEYSDDDTNVVKPKIPYEFFRFQNALKALTHTIHRFSETDEHYKLTNSYCYKNLNPARLTILREIIPDFIVEYSTPEKCNGKPYVVEVISIPKNIKK